MDRPLVSVITPSWQRHDLLLATIENVRQQTYRPLEHVIVSDGPDYWLDNLLCEGGFVQQAARGSEVPISFVELGRNWSSFLTESYAAAPVIVGQLMARGEYQCLWADDERALTPDHIGGLVDALETYDADFAYPRVRMHWRGQSPDDGWDIGTDPPRHGQITHWLYRASMLDLMRGPYRTHVGRANDWEFVSRAMAAGARWAFVPRVTFSHRADA